MTTHQHNTIAAMRKLADVIASLSFCAHLPDPVPQIAERARADILAALALLDAPATETEGTPV
jgi:hypothetical protein